MPFPRSVIPEHISRPFIPGPLKDRAHSGGIQIRATKQVGWIWEETWGLLNVLNVDDEALMTTIDHYWNRGIIDTVTHPLVPGSGAARKGVGGGTPLVNGAAQTGDSIITDGWTPSVTNSVRTGDVIKLAGDNAVYRVRSDGSSDGAGNMTIDIVPNLRLSPLNNAAVTFTGVTFRVIVLRRSSFESSRSPIYFAGMTVTFAEMLL